MGNWKDMLLMAIGLICLTVVGVVAILSNNPYLIRVRMEMDNNTFSAFQTMALLQTNTTANNSVCYPAKIEELWAKNDSGSVSYDQESHYAHSYPGNKPILVCNGMVVR